jgi:hypothetical protein
MLAIAVAAALFLHRTRTGHHVYAVGGSAEVARLSGVSTTRTTIVAEGIETEEELSTLRYLGVDWGQGYFLARPGPLPLPEIDLGPAEEVPQKTHTPATSYANNNRVWSIDQYDQLSQQARPPASRNWWTAYGVSAAIAAAVAYVFIVPPDQVPRGSIALLLTAASLLFAFVCARVVVNTGISLRSPWPWFGLASLSWLAGSLVWSINELVLDSGWVYPSWADVGFLGFFPFFVMGMFFIARKGLERTPIIEVITDGLIILTFVVVMMAELLVFPVQAMESAGTVERLLTTAFAALAMPVFYLALVTFIWQRRLLGFRPLGLVLGGGILLAGGVYVIAWFFGSEALYPVAVGLALAVVFVIALLILPLPPLLLDLFIALSIGVSLMVLLVALYTLHPLDFSAFPAILLLLTLFRLALNVSSTRLILGEGEAGEVIKAFGQFVIGGNYAVGLVIFLILIGINFIVITKGAGRVAEVAARITLDAIPGNQMANDADLTAGLID